MGASFGEIPVPSSVEPNIQMRDVEFLLIQHVFQSDNHLINAVTQVQMRRCDAL